MSRKSLEWKPIHIEKKLDKLLEIIRHSKDENPFNKTRFAEKLNRWEEQILQIHDKTDYIKNRIAPQLERTLGFKIKNKELLIVAMFQPSTKNLFLELEIQYRNEKDVPLSSDEFVTLISVSEIAKVFALLGDAAISMGVLYRLWQNNLDDVGQLTQKKAEIVSNQHMADLCDRWQLYEHRIHFDPATPSKSEIEHDKGTLIEAIYGIIQMEYGFPKVRESIKHLL
ncbi:MAG: hypothetical protein JW779_07900 [Candidatus Thorarchaeota archaeon]|nr:hypothetical protein [Candidatus Thorarchaeota archaeon]